MSSKSGHANCTIRFLVAIIFSILCGCGGGSGGGSGVSSNDPVDKTVALVTVVDGDNQTATVGAELSSPLVAMIKNAAGQPISGQIVNFVVTTGGGSVFAEAAMSDESGIARERWTLGTAAGVQKVEVRAVDSNGTAVVFATFNATATAGAPKSISIVSGNVQSATQLQPLAKPVVAIVKDSYGNPVSGITVAFTVASTFNNGGAAVPGLATTDAVGQASSAWTLGQTLGDQELAATVTGLTPVYFHATALQAPPSAATKIAIVSGDTQTVVQHKMVPQPLVVAVTDALGNPVPGTQVTFSATAGSGYINPLTEVIAWGTGIKTMETPKTDISGKTSWQGFFHTAGPINIVASVGGVASNALTINVTPYNHPYDGWYDCNFSFNQPIPIETHGYVFTDGVFAGLPLDEVTGAWNMTFSNCSFCFSYRTISGQLVLDSLQRVTGTGTFYDANGKDPSTPHYEDGTWTCDRR